MLSSCLNPDAGPSQDRLRAVMADADQHYHERLEKAPPGYGSGPRPHLGLLVSASLSTLPLPLTHLRAHPLSWEAEEEYQGLAQKAAQDRADAKKCKKEADKARRHRPSPHACPHPHGTQGASGSRGRGCRAGQASGQAASHVGQQAAPSPSPPSPPWVGFLERVPFVRVQFSPEGYPGT
jgi:hypothetical protein